VTVDDGLAGRLREEIGRLTRVPAAEFVAGRTARVRELKAAGERELADALGGRRRPTVPAWAIDQLAHHHRGELERLFAAADAVRAAQSADPPDRDAVRQATTSFTGCVRRLRQLAGDALAEGGTAPAAHLDEVEATLLAAATDDEVAADVRAGALLRPAPSPGFAALTSSATGAGPRAGSPPPSDGGDLAALRARRQALCDQLAELEHAAREASDGAAAHRERAATHRTRAAELRAEAERREREASAAEDAATQADDDAREAVARVAAPEGEIAELDARGAAGPAAAG
jgi:hypothetical protein